MQEDAIVISGEDVHQAKPRKYEVESGDHESSDHPATEPDEDANQQVNPTALTPLKLDISGDIESPSPVSVSGERCDCCAVHTAKLWQGARAGLDDPHAVCTLCYLTGHLDSPTAAHGRLAYLPGFAIADAIHLQRRALLAILGGDKKQKIQGERVWEWMNRHAREVEVAWGTASAVEFAHAMKRLTPNKRAQLQIRLTDCVLILPADMFEDQSLLLPTGKTARSVLNSYSWGTYTRSDMYAEPCSLD